MEVTIIEEVANGLLDLVPDLQNCYLITTAEPEVPVFKKKRSTMLFRGYRIIFAGANNGNTGQTKFHPTGGTVVGSDFTGNKNRGFLR